MIHRTHQTFRFSQNPFWLLSLRHIGYQLRGNIRDSYSLLNVTNDSSDDEVREAYLRLAKIYHPDSGTSSGDPRKFNQVREAYMTIKNHRSSSSGIQADEQQMDSDLDFDIQHTVPQHRQYLNYDGVGFGTPLQRQKQYAQHRVRKASEDMFELKKAKWTKPSESALMNKTKAKARRNKISNTIDRVVEDLIQESMQRGDFDNLAGYGKPIDYKDRNPLLDTTTYKINKMLKDEGFAPDWIMLEKDIRDALMEARSHLARVIEKIGSPPFSSPVQDRAWKFEYERFEAKISLVNDSVKKFNLIVPVLKKQLIPYSAERELNRVLENHKEYLAGPLSRDLTPDPGLVFVGDSLSGQAPQSSSLDNVILWGEVWKQIKSLFSWRKTQEQS